jgi:hypothetical protein
MKTKLEILEETINAYNSTNRAFDPSGCLYRAPETGNRCAVGRCLRDDSVLILEPVKYQEVSAYELDGKHENCSVGKVPALEEELKPEYCGHSLEFWSELQTLHDNRLNWNDTGLSNHGLEKVKNIKDLIEKDEY